MSQVIVDTRLDEIEMEIKQHLKRQWDDVLAIGKLAIEAKGLIPHGGFTAWVNNDLGLSIRLIQGYMRIYERFSNTQTFRFVPISGLLMLASPSVSDGLIVEVGSRIEQGEKFTVEGIDNLIDRYKVLEGAKIGSQALLANYATKADGRPAPTISRSAVTSLEKVADEGLRHGAVTIDGQDRPVNLALPQAVVLAVQHETSRRQSEHIDDNVVKKIYSEAVVCEIATDDALHDMGYVTIRMLNREAYNQLTNGQTVTIKFEK